MTPRNTAAPNGNQPVEKIPQKCFRIAPFFYVPRKSVMLNFLQSAATMVSAAYLHVQADERLR